MMLVYLFARSSRRIWVTILEVSIRENGIFSNINNVKSCKFIVKINMTITSSRCWAIKDYLFEERFALTHHTVFLLFLVRNHVSKENEFWPFMVTTSHNFHGKMNQAHTELAWSENVQNWYRKQYLDMIRL